MSDKPKRSRTENFSVNEKSLLINLASKYCNILENKRTDHISTKQKSDAWNNITTEFNATSIDNINRNKYCLKRLYENKKKEVRKRVADENMEIKKTGGGIPPKVPNDPCQDVLLSIMNPKTIYGLNSPWGGDAQGDAQTVEDVPEIICEVNIPGPSKPIKSMTCNQKSWKKYTPVDLKSPLHPALQPSISPEETASCDDVVTNNLEQKSESIPNNSNEVLQVNRQPRAPLGVGRRRPMQTVRALTSSDIAQKYNELLDKKMHIANFQETKVKQDIEEGKIRKRLLQLEVMLKKKQLNSMDKKN